MEHLEFNQYTLILIVLGVILVMVTLYCSFKKIKRNRTRFAIIFSTLIVVGIGVLVLSPTIDDYDRNHLDDNLSDTPHEQSQLMLSGKVVDGMTGQSLQANVELVQDGKSIVTKECDSEGGFEIEVKTGEYDLVATYPGYVAKGKKYDQRRIIIDDVSLDYGTIDLWPEAQVTGRVVSEGKGLAAEIKFSYQSDVAESGGYVFKTLRTDNNGYFTLDKAYAGTQIIELKSEGYFEQKLTDVMLKFGSTTNLGDIPLKPGMTVFGVVEDKTSKKGVPNASVKFVDLSRKVLVETKTAEDGSYTLPLTDMKKLYISVSADNYIADSKLIISNEYSRYEHNVLLAKNTKQTTSSDIKQNREESQNVDKYIEESDMFEAARRAFDENEEAFNNAMSIHLNDVPDGMSIDQYIQMNLPLKAAAISKAAQKYSEIINNYKSPEVGMDSMIRLGMLYQSVADELMAAPIPPDLPDHVETQYIALIDQFALQFAEKEVMYYESAIKISSEHHINSEQIKLIENILFNIRY